MLVCYVVHYVEKWRVGKVARELFLFWEMPPKKCHPFKWYGWARCQVNVRHQKKVMACVACVVCVCALLCHEVVAGRLSLLGTLWWQVCCASKVERGCRGCRTACTPVSFVNEIIFQSSSVHVCCFVLCCACVLRCVILRCGQSLQEILAVRYIVVAGALCVESGVRVSRV